jgi:hypothetical protein
MRDKTIPEVTVKLGETDASFHRSGQSSPAVAKILGVTRDHQGEIRHVVLDRIVHKPGEGNFIGWNVRGAVVSELTRN